MRHRNSSQPEEHMCLVEPLLACDMDICNCSRFCTSLLAAQGCKRTKYNYNPVMDIIRIMK
jgi:hypothetical protein